MADISFLQERFEKKKIVEMIDEKGNTTGMPRHYIGLSGLAGGCMRNLWYTFRWVKASSISGRTNRIFAVGHASEEVMVKDLRSIGIECWNVLDDQDEFTAAFGYAMGHPDGYGKGVPGNEEETHLLEFKTANEKSFKDMVKKGVKESKPVYYGQMVLYMHMKALNKALFMMVNKNTSEYYTEIVDKNYDYAVELLKRGESIVFCENPNEFTRIGSGKPDWFECRWCNYNDICFGKEEVAENCRTCQNCDLLGDGKFACGKDNDRLLNLDDQLKGCNLYEKMECFKI